MIQSLTEKTLYLLVTYCPEQSRFSALEQVIQSLKNEQQTKNFDIEKNLTVFDNGSPNETLELLKRNFKSSLIFSTQENKGYWSAINWILQQSFTNSYEYIYIIEADHFHFGLDKIKNCEITLDKYPFLGSVRTQEYDVKNSILYNKTLAHPSGRRYAWVAHINHVTGENITTQNLDDDLMVYQSNFLACLHSVNRMKTLKKCFQRLQALGNISENTFQEYYHEEYPIIGQLDGGVFHAKLGCTLDDKNIVSGSWTSKEKLKKINYFTTRVDVIRDYESVVTL